MSVLLQVGEWSQKIVVEDYPRSFVSDWYHDVRREGEEELRVDSMTFLPEQWDSLMLLREMEREGSETLARSDSELTPLCGCHNGLAVKSMGVFLHYSEVKESLRAMGGVTEWDWTLFVVLDESDDPSERYHINKKRGEVLRRMGMVYNVGTTGILLASVAFNCMEIAIARADEGDKEEVEDVMRGIIHNGYMMIGESFFVDWAYIIWEDILLLCERMNVSTEGMDGAMALAGRLPMGRLTRSKLPFHWYSTPLTTSLIETSVSLLYWRVMQDFNESTPLEDVGLAALGNRMVEVLPYGGRWVGLVDHTKFINCLIVCELDRRRNEGSYNYHLSCSRMNETVAYMRRHLGLLGLAKCYLIVLNYCERELSKRALAFCYSAEALLKREGCEGDVALYCRRLLASYDLPRLRRVMEKGDPDRLLLSTVDRQVESTSHCSIL